MIFFVLLLAIVNTKTSEEELREAACVIFSRYILQVQGQQSSQFIGKLINQHKYSQDEAIYIVQASPLDKCLMNIKNREVTRILDGLQTQELDVKKYEHLYEGIKYDRFIQNEKEKPKLNQLIDIIKDVEELIATQWQKRPDEEKRREEAKYAEEQDLELEQEIQELPIIEQFDIRKVPLKFILLKNKEYLIFALLVLLPLVLLINCCRSSKNKEKKQTEKSTKKSESNKESLKKEESKSTEQSKQSKSKVSEEKEGSKKSNDKKEKSQKPKDE